MNPPLRIVALLFCVLGCLAVARAAEPVGIGEQAATLPVPENLPAATVQKAILLAGTGRGWTVTSRDDEQVVLFLEHGGWRSTLTVKYNSRQVTIYSNSAKLDRKGRPKKFAIPENWVKFLKQDITKHLGAAAFGT